MLTTPKPPHFRGTGCACLKSLLWTETSKLLMLERPPSTPLRKHPLPDLQRLPDLRRLAGGAEFPDERAVGGEMPEQVGVIQLAGEGRAVIPGGPLHVMDVAADEVRGDRFQPLPVVEQTEV